MSCFFLSSIAVSIIFIVFCPYELYCSCIYIVHCWRIVNNYFSGEARITYFIASSAASTVYLSPQCLFLRAEQGRRPARSAVRRFSVDLSTFP